MNGNINNLKLRYLETFENIKLDQAFYTSSGRGLCVSKNLM